MGGLFAVCFTGISISGARDLSVNDILEALPVSHETVRLMKKDLIEMDMVSQFKRGRRTYLHPTQHLITEIDAYLARISVYIDKNIGSLRQIEMVETFNRVFVCGTMVMRCG